QIWVRAAAVRVKLDDVLERGHAAVMHVGRRADDLAERGGFERAVIAGIGRNGETAFVGNLPALPGDTGVVESLVAEIGAHMTRGAVPLAAEHLQTQLLFCR